MGWCQIGLSTTGGWHGIFKTNQGDHDCTVPPTGEQYREAEKARSKQTNNIFVYTRQNEIWPGPPPKKQCWGQEANVEKHKTGQRRKNYMPRGAKAEQTMREA